MFLNFFQRCPSFIRLNISVKVKYCSAELQGANSNHWKLEGTVQIEYPAKARYKYHIKILLQKNHSF